jgi:hypothetical protein
MKVFTWSGERPDVYLFCNLENVLLSFIFTVEWMIANPLIIFGKTAHLMCASISSNTHNVISWLGGKHYSTLTYSGGNADPPKYGVIRKWQRNKFESILQIYKFDEMDVFNRVQSAAMRTEKDCH